MEFCDPQICPKCGELYEGYNGNYSVDGEIMCGKCINNFPKLNTMPYFVTHIPTFVDGATCKIFTFENEEMFYEKIKNRLSENCILVKSRDYILSQSIYQSWWWVLGGINNFDINKLNIPKINYDIYNEDKSVNQIELNIWLKNKTIIKNK